MAKNKKKKQKMYAIKQGEQYFIGFSQYGATPLFSAHPSPFSREDAETLVKLVPGAKIVPTQYRLTKEEKLLQRVFGVGLGNMQSKVAKLSGPCDHGVVSNYDIKLPLGVEILDCSEDEDGSEFVVWLKARQEGPSHYVTTVTPPTACFPQAELVAAAFDAFLKTTAGQTAALEYIKHDMNLKEKAA
jgi:hypothetical protein